MTKLASALPSVRSLPAAETASPSLVPKRFLGRQPILDAERHLFGYELFYREGKTDHFAVDPEQATREVVDHWLLLIPDLGQGTSFVNCARGAIVDGLVTLLPPESTVLEILEDVDPDPELINCCLALKAKGYRFALDGFLPRPSRAFQISRPAPVATSATRIDQGGPARLGPNFSWSEVAGRRK